MSTPFANVRKNFDAIQHNIKSKIDAINRINPTPSLDSSCYSEGMQIDPIGKKVAENSVRARALIDELSITYCVNRSPDQERPLQNNVNIIDGEWTVITP